MKTIAKITILACLLLLQAFVIAQTTFTSSYVALHHNGLATFHTGLATAYTASEAGDTIYLPGGEFQAININKKLTIIGVGYYPDSITATGYSSMRYIEFGSEAAGGSLTGVYCWHIEMRGYTGQPFTGSYTIKRCGIEKLFCRYEGPMFNVNLEENVLYSTNLSSGYNVAVVNFTRNIIFYNKANYFNHKSGYNNNIIYIDDTIPDFNGALLSNNIFISNATSLNLCRAQSCAFEKNIFCSTAGPLTVSNWGINGNINLGNYEGYKTDSVFVNANNFIDATTDNWPPAATSYVYTNNYHLKGSLPVSVIGTDGTQVGIYGTPLPAKDGWLPFNPHISSKVIGTSLSPTGNLKVIMKVTSQDR